MNCWRSCTKCRIRDDHYRTALTGRHIAQSICHTIHSELQRSTECLQSARLFEFRQAEEVQHRLISRQHVRFDQFD